ncbi:MAG: GntR family transcriptional regulator [Acidimicrobiia bacterium]|nr:GntR family transcriptional regulator [Acidimicrobiia bacterium]
MSSQAFVEIRRMIIRLELAPGDAVREDELGVRLGIGRTPIREALQRLARDQFVTVVPRRGMSVSTIEPADLALLYETRSVLEPYAARLACLRGGSEHWLKMRDVLSVAAGSVDDDELLSVDRRCHEIVWEAAGNRFTTDTLDMLYAHSDRVWHMYLADVADTRHAVVEHAEILDALEAGDAERAATLVEAHVRSFDDEVRSAVERSLTPPLARVD